MHVYVHFPVIEERVFIGHNGSLPERHNVHQCWPPKQQKYEMNVKIEN